MAEQGLTDTEAVKKAQELLSIRAQEKSRLDDVRDYLKPDRQRRMTFLVPGVPKEVKILARVGKVNMLRFVVRAAYQSMYVDGYRTPRGDENHPVWRSWQQNQMDRRQIGVHKAALSYGKSYITVLPAEGHQIAIRGHSPRSMTTAWGDDDVWPEYALQWRAHQGRWRLYDKTHAYDFEPGEPGSIPQKLQRVDRRAHNVGVCPVVCYRDTDDLDDPVIGIVEPLYDLQDQIDVTTFGLLVAQHFGAFKQRWIIGWLAESEEQKLKVSASRLMQFEDSPEDVKVGEFSQTDLKGYIESREATLRHMATISQTSAHEMLGQLANLSAEALAAADESRNRASMEHRTVMGESHEQTFDLAGRLTSQPVEPEDEVRWRDTKVSTLAQIVDALGKAAQMLEIPRRALWDRFADAIGASQSEVDSWDTLRAEQQARDTLTAALTTREPRQIGPAPASGGVS